MQRAQSDYVQGHSTERPSGSASVSPRQALHRDSTSRPGTAPSMTRRLVVVTVFLLVVLAAALVMTMAAGSVRHMPTTPPADSQPGPVPTPVAT